MVITTLIKPLPPACLQTYYYAPNVASDNLNNFISSLGNVPGFAPLQELLPPSNPPPEVEYVSAYAAPPPPSLAGKLKPKDSSDTLALLCLRAMHQRQQHNFSVVVLT